MFALLRRLSPVLLVVVALLLTTASAAAEGTIASRTPGKSNRQPASVAIPQLGMWIPTAPGNYQAVVDMEALLGRELNIVQWYQAWGSATNAGFRADNVTKVQAAGKLPLITWEPWTPGQGVNQPAYSLKAIAAGNHDAYIRTWAQAAKATGGQMLIRFAHEMNGNWYPWAVGVNGNTASDYLAAWNHVYQIFQSEKATNVKFVWSPNTEYPGSTPIEQMFPGDAQVDWVAIDGYNWGTERSTSTWRSFNTTFAATYAKLVQLSTRPVMIAETASSESGGDKAAWIREGLNLTNLQTNFPRVAAVVWFNEQKTGNWPIQTSAAATQAFVDTVNTWR